MAKELQMRMTVPLWGESSTIVSVVFTRWLPLGEEKGLTVHDEYMAIRFWIDEGCVALDSNLTSEHIQSRTNLWLSKIHINVDRVWIDDDLANHLEDICREPDRFEEDIDNKYGQGVWRKYRDICLMLYKTAIQWLNRILTFCRATKGQYWVHEWILDMENVFSELIKLNAEVKVEAGKWFLLKAPAVCHDTIEFPDSTRYITESDWTALQTFLERKSRSDLVGMLLAAAEEFAHLGHRRVALTEAVSALEIAVRQFGRKSESSRGLAGKADRFGAASIGSHIDHIGITCTVNYFFPMIFQETDIPTEVLNNCQEAIRERNNIIHQGQRDVSKEKVFKYLIAIRTLCRTLKTFESEPDPEKD